jgi:hypothetical protein
MRTISKAAAFEDLILSLSKDEVFGGRGRAVSL